MYDVSGADTGREWIEVTNTADESVDLSTFKLLENGVNHKIAALGSAILAGHSSAVLAAAPEKFKADWPSFTGQLFDSAFSLSNDGETLGLRDKEGRAVDSVSYKTGSADGNGLSLSRGDDGVFVSSKPSPGVYESNPQKVTIAPPTKTVTSKSGSGLKSKDSADLKSKENVAAADIALPEAYAKPQSKNTLWVWALASVALILLGVGSVFALTMNSKPRTEKEARAEALRREALEYEIIE